MALELFEHQAGACENLIELNKNHRSAGAMMVTGGGKSFLAMHQMIEAADNPNYHGISDEVGRDGRRKAVYDIVRGVVNDAEILYLSPTTDIAVQIQKDIVEFVLGVPEEELEKMEMPQIERMVERAFPNLHFACYQGLGSEVLYKDKNGREVNVETATPDLVILDEVHRSGATTFKPAVAKLLGYDIVETPEGEMVRKTPNAPKGKENIHLLSISATPERDVDDRDMIRYWNELIGGYSKEELDERKDFAVLLDLPDAVKNGIVTPPEVIAFDANLVETEQYQYLVNQTTNQSISSSLRKEFGDRLREINTSIFGKEHADFHLLSPKEQEELKLEKNAEVIRQAVKDGKLNLHGKYLIFSKSRKSKDGSIVEEVEGNDIENAKDTDNEAIKHLKKQASTIIGTISKALGRDIDNDNDRDSWCLSSEGQTGSENKKLLNRFDSKKVTKTSKLSFLTATQKLDEGVHVKGLTGAFMLKPICEAGENITLRGQSIRFLQEVGRTMSAGTKEPRVLFDYCNNVFRQSISKVLSPDKMIDAFRLTPNQELLASTYRQMTQKIPPRGQLSEEYTKLVAILDVLRKYHSSLNADIIKGKLSDVLKKSEFEGYANEILREIAERGYEDVGKYPIGVTLGQARNLLNSKQSKEDVGKCFSTFNIKELIELGIIDLTSKVGRKAFEEGTIEFDDNGFVVSSNLRNLIFQNKETGTRYNKNGVDIEGYREGQFDELTGLDKDGYDRRGFNAEGKQRDTGTIHDKRGFMADGTNILTGNRFDKAGYDIRGYKLFKFNLIDPETHEVRGVKDVVVSRDGLFHKVPIDPETGEPDYDEVCPVGEKYYQLHDGKKIDSHGFLSSNKSRNLLTCMEFGVSLDETWLSQFRVIKRRGLEKDSSGKERFIEYYTAYDKNGNTYSGYGVRNLNPCGTEFADVPGFEPVDIDGFNRNGFNINGIHKETGTRYDPEGLTEKDYSERYKSAKQMAEFLAKCGQFTEEELRTQMGIGQDGKDIITGTREDIYGFTCMNKVQPACMKEKNKYGFMAEEIPKHVFKDSIGKQYKEIQGSRGIRVNILGTDFCGRKSNGELHEALVTLDNYTKCCIEGDMEDEKYFEETAKAKKMLVQDVKQELIVDMNKAFELYRLCPGIFRDENTKKMFGTIFRAPSDKLNKKIFARCPTLRETLCTDIVDISDRLKLLDGKLNTGRLPEKDKERLENEQRRLNTRLKEMKLLQKKGSEDGR